MSDSPRTPDGTPDHCPVCLGDLYIKSREPIGETACRHCGQLLWYVNWQQETHYYRREEDSEAMRRRIETILPSLRRMDSLDFVELVLEIEERPGVSSSEKESTTFMAVLEALEFLILRVPR